MALQNHGFNFRQHAATTQQSFKYLNPFCKRERLRQLAGLVDET